METTIVCWGYIGKMENKMETTILYYLVLVVRKIIVITEVNGPFVSLDISREGPSEGSNPEMGPLTSKIPNQHEDLKQQQRKP